MIDASAGNKKEIMMNTVFIMQSVLAFAQGFCLLCDHLLNRSVWPWWKKQAYHQNTNELMNKHSRCSRTFLWDERCQRWKTPVLFWGSIKSLRIRKDDAATQPSGKHISLHSSLTIPLTKQLLCFMTLSPGSECDITTFTVLAISIFSNCYNSITQLIRNWLETGF